MSQNGQTHFKNFAGFAARSLKCAWPFWDIIHWRVKRERFIDAKFDNGIPALGDSNIGAQINKKLNDGEKHTNDPFIFNPFMTEIPIILKPVHNFRHERVNVL